MLPAVDANIAAFENAIFDPVGGPGDNGAQSTANAQVQDFENFDMFRSQPLPPWRQRFKDVDDHPIKSGVSVVCTLLALFLPDVKDALLHKDWDDTVHSVMAFVFAFCACEILVQLCANRAHYTSIFFWLDLVATVSLAGEVPALAGLFGEETACAGALALGGGLDGTITRTGRAARAGARAGRLEALVRVGKFFNKLHQAVEEPKEAAEVVPSALASMVSHALSRTVIVVVITTVVCTVSFGYTPDQYWQQTSIEGLLETFKHAEYTHDGICRDSNDDCLRNISSVPELMLAELSRWSIGYPHIDNVEKGNGAQLLFLQLQISSSRPSEVKVDEVHKRDLLRDSELYPVCGMGYVALFDGKFDSQRAAFGRMKITMTIVVISVIAGFLLSVEMNGFLSVPMQRLRKSQVLSQALLIFFESKDPIPTLEKSCKEILCCEVVNIFFFDRSTNELSCTRTLNDESPYSNELRVMFGKGVIGKCAQTCLPVTANFESVAELPKDDPSLRSQVPKRGKREAFEWSARSVLCFPLTFQVGQTKECVGVMQAINKLPDSQTATSLVEHFKLLVGYTQRNLSFGDFELHMMHRLGREVSHILKGLQMDAMYENIFTDDSAEAAVMQSLMSEFSTAEVVTAARHKKEKGPDLKFLFDLYDTDNSGDFNLSELRQFASEMGKEMTDEELDAAIAEMDVDAGGTVCFPEFAEWWNTSNSTLRQQIDAVHAAPPSIDRLLTGLTLPQLQDLRQWGFSCLSYSVEQLCGMSLLMITDPELHICDDLTVSPDTVMKFATQLLGNYNSVPYHNYYHGFSVMQGLYYLVTSTEMCGSLSSLEKFAMLIAGMGHDVGHDGVNTAFHVDSRSDLANMYNDNSPLENLHARETFAAMQQSGCDVLSSLKTVDFKRCRRLIIESIINTDMTFHKRHVDFMSAKQQFDMEEPSERDALMQMLVHLADMGASSYSWNEAPRWARMVMTEFQAQVNQEKSEGMAVSGFMDTMGDEVADEEVLGKFAGSQVGFVGFVLVPFFALFPPHMPELEAPFDQLKENKQNWEKVKAGEMALPPALEEDDEKLGWSVNVGLVALGPAKTGRGSTTAVMKLASAKAGGVA